MKKLFPALLATLMLALVGCSGEKESSAPASSSAAPASSSSAAPASSSSAAPASSSSEAPASSSSEAPAAEQPAADPDFLEVVEHTWVDGTAATNSDGKEYIPLTDGDKVGVKISIQNYTVTDDANADTALNSKGQIDPSNKTDAFLTYKITAPKAGVYQMVMRGKTKEDAMERKFENRGLTVKVNGVAADISGDRQPLVATDTDFVVVPSIALSGEEDTIQITACYYRIQFDVESFIIFAEH